MILVHAGLGLLILARFHGRTTAALLGLSLMLRVGLVFWDLNFSDVLLLPNSGADTESYYYWAVRVAQDPSLVFVDIRGEVYSKAMGMLFWVTGPLRVLGQYTNVLLGISAVLLMVDLLDRFELRDGPRARALAVIALLPNALVLSAIFLRESLISFLVAVSLYFFVRWFRGGAPLNIGAVAAAIMAASTLHAGVIAVGVGYAIAVIFYDRKKGRFGFGPQSVLYLAFFVIVSYFVVAQYPDLFLGKFESFESENELLRASNFRGGGSQYLSGQTVASYGDLLRVGPLRALYFLASPMPWDFRGLVDFLTFALDSLFYVGVPIMFLARRRSISPQWRVLGYALLIALSVASLLFGAGVTNAGTAARHRFKLVSIAMALLIVAGTSVVSRRPVGRPAVKGTRPGGSASVSNRRPHSQHPLLGSTERGALHG